MTDNVSSDLFDAIAMYADLGRAVTTLYAVHGKIGTRVVSWDDWEIVVRVVRQLEDELLGKRFSIVEK